MEVNTFPSDKRPHPPQQLCSQQRQTLVAGRDAAGFSSNLSQSKQHDSKKKIYTHNANTHRLIGYFSLNTNIVGGGGKLTMEEN